MHNVGTRPTGLPETGGQACAQAVDSLRVSCGEKIRLIRSQIILPTALWISTCSFPSLYTICIQYCTAYVDSLTTVKYRLYTLYTGPINTTTN